MVVENGSPQPQRGGGFSLLAVVPPPGPVYRILHWLIVIAAVILSLWALYVGGWGILLLLVTVPVLVVSGCCLLGRVPSCWWLGVLACIVGVCACLWGMVESDDDLWGFAFAGVLVYGYSALAILSGRRALHGAASAAVSPAPEQVDQWEEDIPYSGKAPPGMVALVLFCVAGIFDFLYHAPGTVLTVREVVSFFMKEDAWWSFSNSGSLVLYLLNTVALCILPPLALYFGITRKRKPVLVCLSVMAALPLLNLLASISYFAFRISTMWGVCSLLLQIFFIVVPIYLCHHIRTSRAMTAYFTYAWRKEGQERT